MVKVFLMFACASMQVYWNSRMSAERGRVAAKCGPCEVVLDLCCGVKKCQEQLLFGARYTISIGLNIEEKGA